MNYIVEPLLKGLQSDIGRKLLRGEYTRWGGVIRKSAGYEGAGEIVAHLRDVLAPETPLSKMANLGGHLVTQMKIDDVQQTVGRVLAMSTVGTAASVLNLGVSVVGFVIMARKLDKVQEGVNRVLSTVQKGHTELLDRLDGVDRELVELRYLACGHQNLLAEAVEEVRAVQRDLVDGYVARVATELDLLARVDRPSDQQLQNALRVFGESRRWLASTIAARPPTPDNPARWFDLLLRYRAWCFANSAEIATLRRATERTRAAEVAADAANQSRGWAANWLGTLVPANDLEGLGRFGHSAFAAVPADARVRLRRMGGGGDGPDGERDLAGAAEVARRMPALGPEWIERQLTLVPMLDMVEETTERMESLADELKMCDERRLGWDRWEALTPPAGERIALLRPAAAA